MQGGSTAVWDEKLRSENENNVGPFKTIRQLLPGLKSHQG